MNIHAVKAIYKFEMARTWRTLFQSIVSPVISTSLYFIVFGAAIGSRITEIEGVSYGAFIVPGLVMLSVMTQALSSGIQRWPMMRPALSEILEAPARASMQPAPAAPEQGRCSPRRRRGVTRLRPSR